MISPSLIAAIGIFGMLQVPQGTAALDCRNGRKVIGWGRRTGGPFQCPCVPWIIAGLRSFEIRNDQVCYKYKDCNRLNKCADCDEQIQGVPTTARLIGVDPARHPEH